MRSEFWGIHNLWEEFNDFFSFFFFLFFNYDKVAKVFVQEHLNFLKICGC